MAGIDSLPAVINSDLIKLNHDADTTGREGQVGGESSEMLA